MDFVRQIIDSSLLDMISLPQSLKNRRVEIIVLPLSEPEDEISADDFAGALSKYANTDLIELEKGAWANAMEEKHGIN